MNYSNAAKVAQKELEEAKSRLEKPDPDYAYMKRVSRNGAITVMRVSKRNFEAIAVKSDVVRSMGIDPASLEDYYEFKRLQKACLEFFRSAHSRQWDAFRERKESFLLPYYQRRRSIYEDYLSSPEWSSKRQQCYREHGTSCFDCKERDGTDIHHLHYETLGEEDPKNDLVPLCSVCHAARHASGNLSEPALGISRPAQSGRRVEHPVFGLGTVVQKEGEGSTARVRVIFDNDGPKWLVESFAKLRNV